MNNLPSANHAIRGVIFDVDGTLVDSNDLHIEAWREAFAQFGKTLGYDEVHAQMGKGGDQLLPVFLSEAELEDFGEALTKTRAELFISTYMPHAKPMPGVRELMQRMKDDGLQIALASSAQEEELAHHKKNLAVDDLLGGITSADDAEHSKPSPDIFLAALRQLQGLRAESCVVIGDSPFDAQAAGKAGMRTIGLLSGGFSAESLHDEKVIAVYRDVEELLEQYDASPFTAATGRSQDL